MSGNNNLTQQEITRYKKIIALKTVGEEGLIKLKQASVLVIGAGTLGAPVLQYLTAIGVGTIGILDNDRVEHRNLPGQLLYGTKDLWQAQNHSGKTKTYRN
ncbi:MAG: hypothetical protein HC896_18135 [Bacteroidales bacterium]|nr:hypothetical protein [Bacteroidales bacterium]